MKRPEILALARTQMNKHGLTGWQVQFIQSKSVAGLCWTYMWHADPARSRGRIELSTDFFDVFSDHDILDTILHEIAHALTKDVTAKYESGRKKGRTRRIVHGADWKATAKRIGCSGERCVSVNAARPEGRYKGICPNGHETVRHRLTHTAKHSTSCEKCDSKRYNSAYMFDWYDNGVLVHRQKNVTRTLDTTTYEAPKPKVIQTPVLMNSSALTYEQRHHLLKKLQEVK